jgi:diguanylate cyclase (GGDEF)-like protein
MQLPFRDNGTTPHQLRIPNSCRKFKIYQSNAAAERDFQVQHNVLFRWKKHLQESHGLLNRALWSLGLIALVMIIAAFDYISGKGIHLFVLFLAPTILATWKLGLVPGWGFSALCAAFGFGIDLWLGRNVFMLFAYFNAVARFTIFSLGAYGSWKIRRMGEALLELSLIDPLTGLNNRRAFLMHGNDELIRMERSKQAISIVFIDLDNFKAINDTQGHDAGDKVIKITANIIAHRLRRSDFAARLGGDEFAAILPSTNGAIALGVADEVQVTLRNTFSEEKIPVSASIGIATFSELPVSFEYMMKCADSLMYEVKYSSKNAVLQRDIDISNTLQHTI